MRSLPPRSLPRMAPPTSLPTTALPTSLPTMVPPTSLPTTAHRLTLHRTTAPPTVGHRSPLADPLPPRRHRRHRKTGLRTPPRWRLQRSASRHEDPPCPWDNTDAPRCPDEKNLDPVRKAKIGSRRRVPPLPQGGHDRPGLLPSMSVKPMLEGPILDTSHATSQSGKRAFHVARSPPTERSDESARRSPSVAFV